MFMSRTPSRMHTFLHSLHANIRTKESEIKNGAEKKLPPLLQIKLSSFTLNTISLYQRIGIDIKSKQIDCSRNLLKKKKK